MSVDRLSSTTLRAQRDTGTPIRDSPANAAAHDRASSLTAALLIANT